VGFNFEKKGDGFVMTNYYVVFRKQRYAPYEVMIVNGLQGRLFYQLRVKGYVVSFIFSSEKLIYTQNLSCLEFMIKHKKHWEHHYEFIKNIKIDGDYPFYESVNCVPNLVE
jgi:hypothetical protein